MESILYTSIKKKKNMFFLFMPGSPKEFFSLKRYQEETGKDFKRITLYLCTEADFRLSEFGLEGGSEACKEVEPEEKRRRLNSDENPAERPGGLEQDSHVDQDALDYEIAKALEESLNDETQESLSKGDDLSDHTSVIQALQNRVPETGQFFIILRRGASLERTFSLWNRERLRKASVFAIHSSLNALSMSSCSL